MLKKLFIAIVAMALVVPAQAQLKGLGKSLGKAAKTATKAVGDVAGDMATDMAANSVSDKIVEFMDTNNNVVETDSDYYKRLESLVAANYTSVDGLSLNYKVYQSDEANILSLANGNIRVYTGMMDLLSDDELLAVIANQIGHIANKDVRDALLKVASEDNASNATGKQLEKMLSLSGDKLGSIINELIQIPYTETQNKAADSYAYDLLKKNGAETDALVSMLKKFAELETVDVDSDDASAEALAVAKYIGVNAGNSARASLVASK